MGGQPALDGGRRVGRAVVQDEVDLELPRDFAIEGLQELL
jgi:hypothetical protein